MLIRTPSAILSAECPIRENLTNPLDEASDVTVGTTRVPVKRFPYIAWNVRSAIGSRLYGGSSVRPSADEEHTAFVPTLCRHRRNHRAPQEHSLRSAEDRTRTWTSSAVNG